MTILLLLGMAAGLYMLAMLFTLAIYALPLYAALSVGFWAHGAGQGVLASISLGLAAGVATWVAGQIFFSTVRSPILRLVVALLFAIPAGIAGYHATYGVAGIAFQPGLARDVLGWIGALVISGCAWTRLVSFQLPVQGAALSQAAMPAAPVQAGH